MEEIEVGTVVKAWHEEYIVIGKVFSNCPQYSYFLIKRDDFDEDVYTDVFYAYWSSILSYRTTDRLKGKEKKRLDCNIIKHKLSGTSLSCHNLTYQDLSDFKLYCGLKREINLRDYANENIKTIFVLQPHYMFRTFHIGNITDKTIQEYNSLQADDIVYILI